MILGGEEGHMMRHDEDLGQDGNEVRYRDINKTGVIERDIPVRDEDGTETGWRETGDRI